MDLDRIADEFLRAAARNKWRRDWEGGGTYLYLEVSEFIEALRGKRGDPTKEAGDVLLVLLSVLAAHGLSTEDALASARRSAAIASALPT